MRKVLSNQTGQRVASEKKALIDDEISAKVTKNIYKNRTQQIKTYARRIHGHHGKGYWIYSFRIGCMKNAKEVELDYHVMFLEDIESDFD